MTIEVSNILIQLSMFTEYSNIVWQLKTEIILMHNWQCLLNTPILYDNWRQKLYSYNCQCLLNIPILYDNWSQQYTHTIVNVYWILQYCMAIEDRNYTHAQLAMFTKYSNIVWQLKTEIILVQLSMFTKYSNIVWQLKTETILMHNWQCLLNTPILYDNCRQKLYLYTLSMLTEYSNIVWQLKTEIILIQLSMFTKYSNVVWQLKTEIILVQLSMLTEYSNIVWQLKTEIIPIQLSMFTKYSNIVWQLKSAIYSTIVNVYWILQYCMTIEDRNYTQQYTHTIVNVYWNTPILYDNWRQKLYNWSQHILTIVNVY